MAAENIIKKKYSNIRSFLSEEDAEVLDAFVNIQKKESRSKAEFLMSAVLGSAITTALIVVFLVLFHSYFFYSEKEITDEYTAEDVVREMCLPGDSLSWTQHSAFGFEFKKFPNDIMCIKTQGTKSFYCYEE